MLFSAMSGLFDTSRFTSVTVGDHTYYYSGLIYIRGFKAGRESIIELAREYMITGLVPFERLHGAFCCAIRRLNGETLFFSDNSNLRCLYVTSDALSDSFIDLVHLKHPLMFDDEAVCEFLALGAPYFGKTLVQGITTTSNDRMYVCSGDTILAMPKGIGDIDAPSGIDDVPGFFRDLARALSDEKVTLSLTGGYDSRLVLACLSDVLSLNTFMSCSDEDEPDVRWAKKAAAATGRTLEVLEVGKPKVSEATLRQAFDAADGIALVIDDDYLRINAFMQDRREAGYTCYLTGDGGVRHKDWHWIQDAPCYRRKHTDVGRFYDQRIQVIARLDPYGDRLAHHYRNMRPRMIAQMRLHVKSINTQSYDAIGFHVQGDTVKQKYNVLSRFVPSYAPLWEMELVRYSYHLPRMKRFFYNSMREITTQTSVPLARTPTVYGTTASSERRYMARDVLFQGIDYGKKAGRLIGRRFLHRSLFVGRPTRWSVSAEVRSLDVSRDAIRYCIDEGFIASSTRGDDLPFGVLGRMIHLYLLAQEMQQTTARPGPDAGPITPADPGHRSLPQVHSRSESVP